MIKFIGTAQRDSEAILYFHYTKGRLNFCKFVTSKDGLEFNGDSKYVTVLNNRGREERHYDWKNFRYSKHDNQYLLTFRSNRKSSPLKIAHSKDLVRLEHVNIIKSIKEAGCIVPDYTHNGNYFMYFGEKNIKIAQSLDLRNWKVKKEVLLESRKDYFDNGELEVGNAFTHEDYILLTYYSKKGKGKEYKYSVGACLFDKNDPSKLLWRSDEPIWEQDEHLEKENIQPLGALNLHNKTILYWQVGEQSVYAVSCPIPGSGYHLKDKTYSMIVKKYHNNPILSPRPHKSWDSRAAFNSAAIYDDGKVHFLYRALGDKDLSVLGYATSKDGITIDERSDEPIYIPREPFETPGGNAFATFADHFVSGGGYGGVEDPRITRVDDRLYLTYVAFDGANPPRAAMSSIHIDDFRNKNWNKWDKAKLISAPGMVNKSAVIFPKKVNGKYAVLHRVYPNILVDFLDDLKFDDYLKGHHFIPPRRKFWDSKKVGAGAPPMETEDGWLLIYQSVGYQDPSRYKIGAMMLDRDNPSKVLYRTHQPIIEPDQHYENNGFKRGVVYPCGAVIMNDRLNVYYGGADSVVCGASADLSKFLSNMKQNREPKLDRVTSPFFN
jgi:beta-1,2-mannobiose phosphorylase / 1,2-beta-oligomannan phosphorylase